MFTAPADAYDRFMGKFSGPLAPLFCDFAGVAAGQRVLDVGCGPGALVAELVRRVGAENVSAVDPASQFVEAARERNPGVDVREASAEQLPFGDDEFDASLAQLVVHFMSDPVGGLSEMRRVTRPGGVVAACVWDHAGGQAAAQPVLGRRARARPGRAGRVAARGSARSGHLTELFGERGLARRARVVARSHSPARRASTHGGSRSRSASGPAGAYLTGLDEERQAEVRERCRQALGSGPLVIAARAWTARGLA